MSKIFISYRRSDAAGYAFALHYRLCKEFGKAAVFYDRDRKHHMPSGCDWEKRIFDAIDCASACIVTIGPDWANAIDDKGLRRLPQADDVVRKEVARALQRAKKRELTLFPALFGNADIPEKDQLPDELHELPKLNAGVYRMDGDTDAAFELLVDELAACPGVKRTLVTQEQTDAINTIKELETSGLISGDIADSLKLNVLKELILTAIKKKGN